MIQLCILLISILLMFICLKITANMQTLIEQITFN